MKADELKIRKYRHAFGYDLRWPNGKKRYYCNTKKGWVRHKCSFIENPYESAIIRETFSKYLDGGSTTSVAQYLNKKYNFPANASYVYSLLKDNKYIGGIDGRSTKYPQLIDTDVFHQAQDRLKKVRGHFRASTRNLLGVQLRCFLCGRVMIPSTPPRYYRCRKRKDIHDGINVPMKSVKAYIKRVVDSLNLKEQPTEYFHIFKRFNYDGNEFSHELNDEYKNTKTTNDPLLEYLSEPRTLEDIINYFNMSLPQAQEQLTDLELQGLIEESSGYYKAI